MAGFQNKTPLKVFAGVIVMVTLSCLKAYVLMPYVYAAFHYDLYHFSCAIVPVFIAMSGMCFIHLANVCDISYTRKSNYPLFILAVAAIIEALIFLAFLASPQFFNYIFAFQQTIWSPLYLSVELAILAWIIYNGFNTFINSDVCDRFYSLFRGSRLFVH